MPDWVCLSESCHGDDGLLRDMEHTLLKLRFCEDVYKYLTHLFPEQGSLQCSEGIPVGRGEKTTFRLSSRVNVHHILGIAMNYKCM